MCSGFVRRVKCARVPPRRRGTQIAYPYRRPLRRRSSRSGRPRGVPARGRRSLGQRGLQHHHPGHHALGSLRRHRALRKHPRREYGRRGAPRRCLRGHRLHRDAAADHDGEHPAASPERWASILVVALARHCSALGLGRLSVRRLAAQVAVYKKPKGRGLTAPALFLPSGGLPTSDQKERTRQEQAKEAEKERDRKERKDKAC